MPATSSLGSATPARAYSSPRSAPRGFADDGNWYIDHLRHDDFSVYQTVRPENLHFVLNTRDKHTVDYELTLSAVGLDGSSVVSNDFIGPWRTGWSLRYGSKVIAAGPHASVNGAAGADLMKIGGVDWLGYCDRRHFPFNPVRANFFDFVIDTPPTGLAYQAVGKDAAEIVYKIWNKIFSRPNSLPITYTQVDTGVIVPYYSIDYGDTSTFLSMLQGLADFFPGFDFWVDPVTLELKLVSPYVYGTPAAIVSGGSGGANIKYLMDDSVIKRPDNLEFTNNGPEQTHLLGVGSNNAGSVGVALGTILGEAAFWRLDGTYDGGTVYSANELKSKTAQQLSYGLNPVHEVPLTLDPDQLTDFWDKITPGVAIWLDYDLGFHALNSPWRVVSIEGTIGNEGNAQVNLGINQIYDTLDMDNLDPPYAGIIEG